MQCQSCGGIYAPVGADGVRYFHRCPALSTVELAAAVVAGKVALPLNETVDVAILRRLYERTAARDENVVPNVDPTKPGVPKALGKGTALAAPPAPAASTAPVSVDV